MLKYLKKLCITCIAIAFGLTFFSNKSNADCENDGHRWMAWEWVTDGHSRTCMNCHETQVLHHNFTLYLNQGEEGHMLKCVQCHYPKTGQIEPHEYENGKCKKCSKTEPRATATPEITPTATPEITVTPEITPTVTPDTTNSDHIRGDVNLDGNITPTDVLQVKEHIVELRTLDGQALNNADIDQNGEITPTDASLLKKHIVGIETEIKW